MKITKKEIGDVRIIYIDGKLDASNTPEAEEIILEYINNKYDKVIINLEKTAYMSSSGLRIILKAAKKLKKTGTLRISNLNDIVEEIFHISGFNKILNIDSTEEESLKKINDNI